jgi:erythronate-4-phosphate dehydrogenase
MCNFAIVMKIIVDDKIPYIREVISQIADEAVYLPGKEIGKMDVKDADALIVRTRTLCDERLLGGSKVQFVATATIGFDHIDTDYLKRAGIEWMNCPGCNAASVAQYIRSSLILLGHQRGLKIHGATLGIVGCGHVGKKVMALAKEMGMNVLVNDPPREDLGDKGVFVSMNEICEKSDFITFHVPMSKNGKYPTVHLADSNFFRKLKRHPVIFNTSRGAVVDNNSLLNALEKDIVKDAVIDTWENEPDINLTLLNKVYIGTPHIAGYSADGKVNADNMVIIGLCDHFGIKRYFHIDPPSLPADFVPLDDPEERSLQLYNPVVDSEKLKSYPEKFEWFRGNYPLRREFI